jgi:hypothetical protein
VLYGNQKGAEIGYNPHKPGRPSHALHTYWVGNLRLVLDVVVSPGKQFSASHAQPGLTAILDGLAPNQRPAMVRGDCGFGNDPFIVELEARNQPYLFKLRQTKGIHKLLQRQFQREDWTLPGPHDQGWSAVEDTVKLGGWDHARRVVILRRPVKQDVALTRKVENQLKLWLKDEATQAYEYAVLVTNTTYDLQAIAQLYRDRADCENGFDELKNQWGWGGYTTQDLARCRLAAGMVALIYNWWNLFVRLADPDHHREAITSRPLLLTAIARRTQHAGQTTLTISSTHGMQHKAREAYARIAGFLAGLRQTAEQLDPLQRWYRILSEALRHFLKGRQLQPPLRLNPA